MPQPRAGLSTLAVHAGTPQGGNSPLTVPIVQSTTFRFESAAQVQEYARGSSGLFMYSRDENPTVRAAEEAVGPAKVCVFESPTNPTLRVVDVATVASACRKAGTVSVIDSTFGPPALQRPLELAVDVVMHSATKYLNGHSDHLAGVLAGSRARLEPLRLISHRL